MSYYPYFHARQAELRAVEAAARRFGGPQQIWPVLEPVDTATKLARTLSRLTTTYRGAYVVINPTLGTSTSTAAQAVWTAAIAPQIAASNLLRPTYRETTTSTTHDIDAFLATYPDRPIGLILTSNKLNPVALAAALSGANVTVFATTATALALAMSLGVAPVLVSDNFNAQPRNADYHGTEWLSSTHIGHSAPGAAGFADYTVLPGSFTPGGGPIGAAAIHITYRESDDSLWVQHFVSDETDRNVGTFQSKLLEAVAHLQVELTATPGRFDRTPPIAAYLGYLKAGAATNASTKKTLQVLHHLHVIANYLGLP